MIGEPEPGVTEMWTCEGCGREMKVPTWPRRRWWRVTERHKRACPQSPELTTMELFGAMGDIYFNYWCHKCKAPHITFLGCPAEETFMEMLLRKSKQPMTVRFR